MKIRAFQPGDESAQLKIYNEVAVALPGFKPATLDEVRRRLRAADFDPNSRFFATEAGQTVGYASFHANGRVSYPWCLPGHESIAEPLVNTVFQAMKERGIRTAFAAYRADWNAQLEFFLARGFHHARDMINFVADLAEMPTPSARRNGTLSPLLPEDLPAVAKLAPGTLRVSSVPDLERCLLQNPYFPPEATFTIRGPDSAPAAVGILVGNSGYANPKQVDPAMPCFRLGAFGTEGMQTKRINGLFSFLSGIEEADRLGLELMNHAALHLRNVEIDSFAAQVPSDARHLLTFYETHFRRQGSFPVLELDLSPAPPSP